MNDSNFFCFWDMMWHLEPHLIKKMPIFWIFTQNFLKFWNFICGFVNENCGRSAENYSKLFLCPKFSSKKFWVKSNHYIILKSKKSTPPEMAIFWGGRNLYVTYPNNVLSWKILDLYFLTFSKSCFSFINLSNFPFHVFASSSWSSQKIN